MNKRLRVYIANTMSVSKYFVYFFALVVSTLLYGVHAQTLDSCSNGTSLNIVAHQDDDLLFLNPDIAKDIQNDRCIVSIYVTAGDADKDSSYWLSRENGLKAAYSSMSGMTNSWNSYTDVVNGHSISLSALNNTVQVKLIFIRLPDGNWNGSGFPNNNYESLQKLWEGNISTIHSVDGLSSYTKQELINTVWQLMEIYSPDLIRTQNYVDSYNHDIDHSDHYTTAYIAYAAHQLYSKPHVFGGYYDYEISLMPTNVFGSDLTVKQNTFLTYAQYDYVLCQTLDSCMQTNYGPWLSRQYAIEPAIVVTDNNTEPPADNDNDNNFLDGTNWQLSASNGSDEKDMQIPSNSLNGKGSVQVTFDLHGTNFGLGADEASIVFIQSNDWYASNIIPFSQNGKNGYQTIIIPLSNFHRIGNTSDILKTDLAVSNLHSRFWNRNSFIVDINEIKLLENSGQTPPPDPEDPPVTDPLPDEDTTPEPGNGEELLASTWVLSGNNGADEKDTSIPSNSIVNKNSIQVKVDLHGKNFGSGDDEASIILIQDNEWYAANLVLYGDNGKDGIQTINVPLADLHQVGNSGNKLDLTKPVTNLHARFWNSSTFNIELTSVKMSGDTGDSPTTPPDSQDPPSTDPTDNSDDQPQSGDNLLSNSWKLSANQGPTENDIEIQSNTLQNATSIRVKIDLNGVSFGGGDDEASIIFIQDGSWYAANVTYFLDNGKDGSQTVSIPIDEFHKVGSSSNKLDTNDSVSNLHARFWNNTTYSVDIDSVSVEY